MCLTTKDKESITVIDVIVHKNEFVIKCMSEKE